MMTDPLRWLPVSLLALSLAASMRAQECPLYSTQPPPEANSCPGPQIVDGSGDAFFNLAENRSLDILSASFTAGAGGDLLITLRLLDLSAPPPSELPAGQWAVYFDSGGTRYIVQANGSSRLPDAILYTAGPLNGEGEEIGTPMYDPVADRISGSFNADSSNTIVFTVPLARIGNPPAGALLTNLVVGTYLSSEVGRSPIVDRAPNDGAGADYEVGEVCIPPAS